ncbi:MAG TPA: hypothetical protein VFH54_06125 [Mycobacteriales bacterium]|nr:hypothetical protein [Mycobacteriales bacterium]
MAVDPQPEDAPTADAPVDEAAAEPPIAEETPAPAEPAATVVTCVRATEAFTASWGCQLLAFAKGEIARGEIAVFLSTAGVPVEPVDED